MTGWRGADLQRLRAEDGPDELVFDPNVPESPEWEAMDPAACKDAGAVQVNALGSGFEQEEAVNSYDEQEAEVANSDVDEDDSNSIGEGGYDSEGGEETEVEDDDTLSDP